MTSLIVDRTEQQSDLVKTKIEIKGGRKKKAIESLVEL